MKTVLLILISINILSCTPKNKVNQNVNAFSSKTVRVDHLTYDEQVSKRSYRFDFDFFSGNIPVWQNLFREYKGQSNLTYLEIGVFQGRSFLWVADNILYEPNNKFIALDVFTGGLFETFNHNIKLAGIDGKTQTLKGPSQQTLREIPFESVDIIYIDGSHHAVDVTSDIAQTWELLKVGGLLIFDDYTWNAFNFPRHMVPKQAIDLFLDTAWFKYQLIHKGRQVAIKKLQDPCRGRPGQWECVPVGTSLVMMKEKKVYVNDRDLNLAPSEYKFVEKILLNRPQGQGYLSISKSELTKPIFKRLQNIMNIQIDETGAVIKASK